MPKYGHVPIPSGHEGEGPQFVSSLHARLRYGVPESRIALPVTGCARPRGEYAVLKLSPVCLMSNSSEEKHQPHATTL